MASASTSTTTSRLKFGLIAGASSAALFALNLTFARLSYRYGTSVDTLNLSRSLLLLFVLLLFCYARGILHVPRGRTLFWLCAIGVLMAGQLYALVGALAFAAVGLVLIVFFTYPILVTLAEHALSATWPRPLLLVAMAIVFTGLGFVLGPRLELLDYRGVLLAILAAFLFAALVMTSSRTMKRLHPALAMAGMLLITSVITLGATFTEGLAWPSASPGWIALIASAVLFCLATVLFFTAIHTLGPTRAAILDNTAPVWGIIWGLVILGETFNVVQLIGASMVVVGVVAAQLLTDRRTDR